MPERVAPVPTPEPGPRASRRRPAGLYVHLPFCASHCAYCTFATSTRLPLLPGTIAAIAAEIVAMGRRGGRPLSSLYLGGGTPSLVDAGNLERLFAAVRLGFSLPAGAEVTLEANPDDVDGDRIEVWRRLGVNRVSVGVQAFQDHVLETLNRRHGAAQASSAVKLVRDAGFIVSLDIMLGLPRLRGTDLEATLAEIVRLRPHHVSAYLLEMDKPHRLGRLAERRPDLFPDADAAAWQYLAVGRTLVAAGYRHYEVSNFALPGFAARHNMRYWLGSPVLAAGPSAHGQCGRRRWANVSDLEGYLARVEAGTSPREWSRRLDPGEAPREAMMLRLRLARGAPAELVRNCGEACPGFLARLDDFLRLGLARRRGEGIRLTPRGWLVSNELFHTLW